MGFALQICAALEHAHEKGAIHRDLKPANIYVLPDGTIKVLDFGLAEFDLNRSSLLQAAGAKKEDLEAALGASPLRAGTPAYMAPEQWHGQPQDVRTDIWAVGAILFRLLTGVLPVGRATEVSDLGPDWRPPSIELPDVRNIGELDVIVARCLRVSPGERFASAGELRGALEQVALSVDQEDARPRSSRLAVFGVALFLLVLLAAAAYVIGTRPATIQSTADVGVSSANATAVVADQNGDLKVQGTAGEAPAAQSAEALFEQAQEHEAGGRLWQASLLYGRLVDENAHAGSKYRLPALRQLAASREKLLAFAEAAGAYARLSVELASAGEREMAALRAAELFEANQQYEEAAQMVSDLCREAPDPPGVCDRLRYLAELYEGAGNLVKAERTYQRYMESCVSIRDQSEQSMDAALKLARLHARHDRTEAAKEWYAKVVTLNQESGGQPGGSAASLAAEAAFKLLESDYERLVGGSSVRRKKYEADELVLLAEDVARLEKSYLAVVEYRDGDWSAAAAYRTGRIRKRMSSLHRELAGAERDIGGMTPQQHEELAKRYDQQAYDIWKEGIDVASSRNSRNVWTRKIRMELNLRDRNRYFHVREIKQYRSVVPLFAALLRPVLPGGDATKAVVGEQAASLHAKAVDGLRQGDLQGALSSAQQALEAAPDQMAIAHLVASLLAHLGLGEELEGYATSLSKLDGCSQTSVVFERGLLLHQGSYLRAVDAARKRLREDEQDLWAMTTMVRAYLGMDKPKTARLVVARMLEIAPDSPEALFYAGAIAEEMQPEISSAVAIYERSIRIVPGLVDVLNNVGLRYHDLGEFQRAVEVFRRALETAPGCTDVRLNLANALRGLRRYAEAEAEYRGLLASHPSLAPAYYNLALLVLENKFGKEDRALRLKEAISLLAIYGKLVSPEVATRDEVNEVVAEAETLVALLEGHPVPGASQAAAGEGGLDKKEVNRVMRKSSHLFHECYKRLPGDEGETAGELRLKVKIDSNGRPTGSILWSEVGDPRMPECIIQKLELISFPKPGKAVTFTLPFRFGTI